MKRYRLHVEVPSHARVRASSNSDRTIDTQAFLIKTKLDASFIMTIYDKRAESMRAFLRWKSSNSKMGQRFLFVKANHIRTFRI